MKQEARKINRALPCREQSASIQSFLGSDEVGAQRQRRPAGRPLRTSIFEDHLHGAVDLEGLHEEDDARGRLVAAQQQDFLREVDQSRREQFTHRMPRRNGESQHDTYQLPHFKDAHTYSRWLCSLYH